MWGLGGQVTVAYKNLCLFPNVQLPAGFKMPKFDLYDGHDRLSLTKLEKKHSESFIEYGFRWREQAARVDPPIKESKMVDYFLQALEPTYYGHLVSAIEKSFNEVVKMGGHDTEKCWHLKSAIQELIDTNRIEVQAIVEQSTSEKSVLKSSERSSEPSVIVKKGSSSDVAAKQERMKVVMPGVASKPIVIVEGARTDHVIIKPGLTRSGRCFAPEELRKDKISKDNPVRVKKVVTEEEAEEFLRKMKVQDYSIVEQLRKMPAQISLLSLLIHSDEHRQALMKILNEAHVPNKITVNHLENIANKIFEVNRVTFSDDELSVEGTEHNRAIYRMVKCENSVVIRVLVDNGSSANIYPLSTLSKLKVEHERIHKNSICVRGFDSGGKDSVGDIMLELTIGPVEFTMEFQVLDIVVSYNLLLGRPWIHATKAVPLTLHQVVKFEWDRQKIVLHGEDSLCAHSDDIISFIEVEDDKGPWVYQVFDTMLVEKVPEGKCILNPKITAASVMVAYEMLKNGFVLGKGLGSSFQGNIQPVSLPKNLGTFGQGFKPTVVDIRRARKLKQRAWVLPKLVPHLSRSFVKSGTKK
ncbi:uncharacterized protein [Nicotiana sylvestris]|uniref:uncharacterized protein n=1 Tax=Nicotiana sylvestris TaxID=4096 RepID=UPI00388CEAF4